MALTLSQNHPAAKKISIWIYSTLLLTAFLSTVFTIIVLINKIYYEQNAINIVLMIFLVFIFLSGVFNAFNFRDIKAVFKKKLY
jgi:ABC-type multidrug transport system permease subunit